jgi:dTDP-4-amino-4,6-dideoxygalactose transaminase
MVHMSAPEINEHDIHDVVSVLRSGRLALGSKTEEFEKVWPNISGLSTRLR